MIERVYNKNSYSTEEVFKKLTSEDEVVYIVGGHQQTHVKIKQWLPTVNVIASRDYTKEISSKATIVILNTSYLNHPMYWKTQNRVEQLQKQNPELQFLYLNTQSTNRERILKELGAQIKI